MKLALVLIAAAAAPALAGPCEIAPLVTIVKTPPGATIDQFGGVVVTNPPAAPWFFVENGTRTKARVTRVAPGLAVYAPVKPERELDLEDKAGHLSHVRFQFQDTDDMPVDAAPRPTAVVQAKRSPIVRSDVVRATLAEAPPAGTIAVLVRASGSRAPAARSWQEVTDGKALTIDIYRRDRCAAVIPGTVATKAGDRIELAWLDAEGHISLWSSPIEVTAGS